MHPIFTSLLISFVATALNGCNNTDAKTTSQQTQADARKKLEQQIIAELPKNHEVIHNRGAYIPAQCYTKTKAENGKVHNPCFSCHNQSIAPNYIDDTEFQIAYSFRDTARKNPWTNLFKDRTNQVAKISNQQILDYVRTSNYFDVNGNIKLVEKFKKIPESWDLNNDKKWNGYQPDCYFNFDQQGFDINPQGQDTGWRAFAYAPFFGTFWPTNGSSNDVIIRLPKAFRQDQQGNFDRTIYQLNLAIVEAMIQRQNIPIQKTDETLYGVDLNRNGTLDLATEVVYRWDPINGKNMSYIGKAKQLLTSGKLHIAGGLYPEGTEFLHTVRYLDIDKNGKTKMAKRLKELRYGIKIGWANYGQLKLAALKETKDAHDFPDRFKKVLGNSESAMLNGLGWAYQGFIEDAQGELRPQNNEETLSCLGCHGGISATTDSSFAFPRKLNNTHFQDGWYHKYQRDLVGTPERRWKDGTWEYSKYLQENHSGNEFRTNNEVLNKFFKRDGTLKPEQIKKLHKDISYLLLPSAKRALKLDKAYKVIVDEQSYIYGRDPHVKPIKNSWDIIPENELTGVEKAVRYQ